MIDKIYFHREKEENWEVVDKAEELGYSDSDSLKTLGYEVGMEIEISKDCKTRKVLRIEGIDVSDKDIFI